METAHVTTASTVSLQQSLVEPDDPDVDTFLRTINDLGRVTVDQRPAAAVCGAAGCRIGDDLAFVDIESVRDRVLCPVHILDYVDREIGLGDVAAAARNELADYFGVNS